MIYLLGSLCAISVLIIFILLVKMIGMRKAAEAIRLQFAARLDADTNVGIDIATSDRAIRRLAADIDRQLKLLRKAQLRYAQGDYELKAAITGISHDLRTPLTAICGYMELLGREPSTDAARRYLSIIANRITVMKTLAEELFHYSIVTSIHRYDQREPVSLNQAVEQCVADYYAVLKARGITPDIVMPETRIERQLNKSALSRILDNVIHNAIKYSDGDLTIRLSEQGTLFFSNHAAQLDEVKIGRLFDRFYTVNNGQGGAGLGLSIAKILTEQMGGRITAAKSNDMFTIIISF